MRPSELRKMFGLEDTYWWFVARRELVRELLLKCCGRRRGPMRILDIGCGSGARQGARTPRSVTGLGIAA